jgi:SPP1 gp7 family putative phage head morphogenesis protein
MPTYQEEAKTILNAFMAKAFRYENKEMLLLADRWKGVFNHLEDLIKKLSEKEVLSPDQLFKLDLYKTFLKESQFEVEKYNNFALGIVKDGQKQFINYGLAATQEQISLITVNFNKINFDAVKNMIGLTSDGSKLSDLFAKSYPESVAKLNQTMVNATALGYNPVKTAKLLAANMNGNLTRSLVIARTEQLNVLRVTSIEQMKESGVVKGWTWIAEADACDYCQEQDGKSFSFDEEMDEHPNGRCAAIPDI